VTTHLITPPAAGTSAPLRLEPMPGMHIVELWACDSLEGGALEAGPPPEFTPAPAAGGVRYRLVTLPPDPVGHMHRTTTIDLVTVVSGEVSLALADGDETVLRPGDTVVLRGTEHAWRNHTDDPALLAVVLLGQAVIQGAA
jgi:quercetin dioxygenase-like cupin family protein